MVCMCFLGKSIRDAACAADAEKQLAGVVSCSVLEYKKIRLMDAFPACSGSQVVAHLSSLWWFFFWCVVVLCPCVVWHAVLVQLASLGCGRVCLVLDGVSSLVAQLE